MRTILVLVVGIVIGAAAFWIYTTKEGKSTARTTGEQIESTTKSARDTIQDKLRSFNLRPEDIKGDLERTGRVVREKSRQAGQAIADATADARITGAIKAKLIANRDLSAMRISVNTTAGVVTLSGSVDTPEAVGKAMLIAMETEGVNQVVSTLQVSMKNGKS